MSARRPLEAFIGLTRLTYLLDIEDRTALTQLFNQLGALSERVPMAALRLPKDGGRLAELAGKQGRLPAAWRTRFHARIQTPFSSEFRGFSAMSGHSKWHTIKHKKGAADAKRGKVFTRIIKELTVAARNGGGDPDMNPRLRTIIADAKRSTCRPTTSSARSGAARAKKKASPTTKITYEGYGPGGVAIIIETLTDNKNRTVGEIRHTLTKYGGNLGEANSVAWMFEKKGYIVVDKAQGRRRDAHGRRARRRRRRHEGRRRRVGNRVAARRRIRPCVDAVKALGIEPGRAPKSRCCRRTTSSSKASRRSRC